MNTQRENLWSRLLEAKLVTGDAPETVVHDRASPWYVKAMLGFSGWLAALFFIAFIGSAMSILFKERPVAFVVGCGMLFAAYRILKDKPEDFLEHLALAISLSGQVLIIYAFMAREHPGLSALGVMLLGLVLTLFVPNIIHRFFTAFITLSALQVFLLVNHAGVLFGGMALLAVIWLWQNEFRHPGHVREMHAIGYGALLALLFNVNTTAHLPMIAMSRNEWQIGQWTGELLLGAALLLGVWSLAHRHAATHTLITVILGGAALVLISLKSPLLALGLLIILLGFGAGNRILIGIGGASVLYAFATFYFQHAQTLMEKSVTLLIAGALLLIIRFILNILSPLPQEASHA